jgi:hypothetical protein
MQPPDDQKSISPPQIRKLRCSVCHRVALISGKDVSRFVTAGWPLCCGEVMSLHHEPEAGKTHGQ